MSTRRRSLDFARDDNITSLAEPSSCLLNPHLDCLSSVAKAEEGNGEISCNILRSLDVARDDEHDVVRDDEHFN